MAAFLPRMLRPALGGAALLSILATGCIHLPRSAYASARKADYLATHPELRPSIAAALERGHVSGGMNAEQVWVVLGTPVRRTRFGSRDEISVWIYPGHRLHQEQLRGDKATLFRIVFIDDRVVLVEPI